MIQEAKSWISKPLEVVVSHVLWRVNAVADLFTKHTIEDVPGYHPVLCNPADVLSNIQKDCNDIAFPGAG